MNKAVLIFNGKGGVGKDYLANYLRNKYTVNIVSSVDKIKEAADIIEPGISTRKNLNDRSFLSTLKAIANDYYYHSLRYLKSQFSYFMQKPEQILIVMIREEDEIKQFKKILNSLYDFKNVHAVLITNKEQEYELYGNLSDDGIHKDSNVYDLIFDNAMTKESNELFIKEIDELIK